MTNGYTERLEELRVGILGMASVQDFVTRLNRGLSKPIPYATAARYHKDREPPVTYLRAVSRVFGVRLDWLVAGEGEPSRRHSAAAAAARAALPPAQELFGSFDSDAADGEEIPYWLAPVGQLALRLWSGSDEDLNHLAAIREALHAPARAISVDVSRLKREDPTAYGNYITAMMPALFILADVRAQQQRESAIRAEEADEEFSDTIDRILDMEP